MGKRKIGALEKVEADLPNLRHKIRIDPLSYMDDFRAQYEQYQSHYSIYLAAPNSADANSLIKLREHIDFVSHVAFCYPEITKALSQDLSTLLSQHHAVLEPELREKVVGSLVLLRNKNQLNSIDLLNTLFPVLVQTRSKSFRTILLQKIVSDLKASNLKTKNHKLNRSVQTVLYNLVVSDPTSSKGLWAVKITREMWKRQIWTDAKSVEIMKEAALSENAKVIAGGVRFFLGGDKEREELEDEESDDDAVDMKELRHQMGINKKTKKRGKELKRAAATVKKKERKKSAPHILNFSALHLLHDPQGFVESLFTKHLQPSKSKLVLENKLAVLQLVTRLIGLHKLTLITIYSWFLKHLAPRQQNVTTFLACLGQATHNLVPPDLIQPCVQKIANEFVSEGSASEVASAGVNAIREICARQPLAMTDTLLQDLVMYRKSKDKGVMMAAKGLLSLYREVGAELLKKRDRGREAALNLRSADRKDIRFGEVEGDGTIDGIELLEAWKEEERRKKRREEGLPSDGEDDENEDEDAIAKDEEEGWKKFNVDNDESEDSGGWIDVESDGDDIELSDSEPESDTEQPAKKKVKFAEALDDDGEKENQDDEGKSGSSPEEEKDEKTTEKRPSNLATTRILTPADLAKLRELQQESSIINTLPHAQRKSAAAKIQAARLARHVDDGLTAEDIEAAAALSKKSTKEEKIQMAKGDKDQSHSSTTAIRKEKKRAEGKSSTNKEKARQKNFLMTLGKAKRKGKRSLGEIQKSMRGHSARQKRGGRRGNR